MLIVPYETLINIVFVISAAGAVMLVLRRLPEATGRVEMDRSKQNQQETPQQELLDKGLPVQSLSKIKSFTQTVWHKIWQFLLEAKGLKQAPKISYGFKKILDIHQESETKAAIIKDENYYIDLIKRNPKDKSYYDLLGGYYFDQSKFKDAANVYQYLTEQSPTKPEFWAKYGLANLYLESFKKAEEGYKKAVELDPSNPSRFYNLALSYRGQLDFRSAVSALEKAIDLEAGNQKYNDLMFEMKNKAQHSVPVENIHKKE